MALTFPPQAVVDHNRRVETTLRRRFNMTFAVYKSIEALAELAAVLLGFYAIYNGADPFLTFMAVAVIVGGWKVLEFLAVYADEITQVSAQLDDDD